MEIVQDLLIEEPRLCPRSMLQGITMSPSTCVGVREGLDIEPQHVGYDSFQLSSAGTSYKSKLCIWQLHTHTHEGAPCHPTSSSDLLEEFQQSETWQEME